MNGFFYYGGVIRKKLPWILLVSLLVTLLALVIAKQVKPSHEVHFSYVVSLSQRDAVTDFRFDGYYALQATDLFAATLAKWLTAPEVLVAAYQESGVALPSDDPRQLSRGVRAEKAAPQLVMVTVRDTNRETAERLAQGLQRVMERNVERYHDHGVPAVEFEVVATEPWTGVTRLSLPVVVIATFVFSFLILLNAVLLIESLRRV